MSDRQNVLIILVVLALFVGLVLGAGAGAFGTYAVLTAPPADEELATSTVPPVNVQVEIIRPEPEREDAFMLPAVVEANRVVRVAAEVAGRIEEINCKEGDLCEPPPPGEQDKAKPLIRLNTDLLESEFERAQAAAQLAEANFDRMSRLAKQGGATDQDLDKARSALRTGKAEEKLASVRLKRARICPPIRGVLNDLLVEKGEYVQRGDPVAEIVDIEAVKVVARVPELDVQFLKTGDPARVAVNIRGKEHRLVGKITYISSLADEGTRATRVEITLDNKQRLLRSGQIVRVHLTRQTLKNVIMVPLSAVIPLENEKAVYVVETVEEKDEKTGETVKKDVARRRSVTLDARLIKTIEQTVTTSKGTRTVRRQIIRVTNGALKAGDRLIVTGHQFVAAGQEVRPEVLQFEAQPKNTPEK
jgi:membrane fusion protein (multidrug efflux system)